MKLLKWLTGDVFKSIGGIIDDVFTSDEERLQAKNEIFKLLSDKSADLDALKSEIIQTEARGNWLQRSWRPLLMLLFGFVVLYSKFIAPAFNLPNAELEPEFWDLLQIGIGGYVVGRSAEKIIKDLSSNLELKRKS